MIVRTASMVIAKKIVNVIYGRIWRRVLGCLCVCMRVLEVKLIEALSLADARVVEVS